MRKIQPSEYEKQNYNEPKNNAFFKKKNNSNASLIWTINSNSNVHWGVQIVFL